MNLTPESHHHLRLRHHLYHIFSPSILWQKVEERGSKKTDFLSLVLWNPYTKHSNAFLSLPLLSLLFSSIVVSTSSWHSSFPLFFSVYFMQDHQSSFTINRSLIICHVFDSSCFSFLLVLVSFFVWLHEKISRARILHDNQMQGERKGEKRDCFYTSLSLR